MANLDEMQRELAAYFEAEKAESVVFLIVGVASLAIGLWLWNTPGYARGVAWPLAGIAVIELIVGAAVYLRARSQVRALASLLVRDASRYASDEKARMVKVRIGFRVYEAIELTLLFAGVALVFLTPKQTFWYGVGTGLVIQCAVVLVLDVLAQRRAVEYVESIHELLS